MYEMADYEFIRNLHYKLGWSIRKISKEQKISRQTIRKALESTEKPKYNLKVEKSNPVMDPYIPLITEWLRNDMESPPKQRHTAVKIFNRLQDEYDFTGGESTVRGHVQRIKLMLEQHKPKGFIPQEFPPGLFGQFDWGDADVILDGIQVTIQLFCMRLCFSRKIFLKAFYHQKQEALLQGHVDAFEYFGFVPKTITYDNLRTAVKTILKGRERIEQDKFIQLRTHYLFDSRFNEPAKGNQKGQVEGLVKYARQNFLVPIPSCTTLDELNDFLRKKCDEYENRQVPQSSLTVQEAFRIESNELLPLPKTALQCCREVYVSSNTISQVAFDTNKYSVPTNYEGRKNLLLKAYVNKIDIYDGNHLIATHQRCYERNEEIFNYDYYLDLLAHRPGSVPFARPLIYAKLEPVFREFEKQLTRTAQGCREFIQILKLLRKYPKEKVVDALDEASSNKMYCFDTIQQILYRKNKEIPNIVPFNEMVYNHLPTVKVQSPDMGKFDQLLYADKKVVLH
jgi:transposase